MRNWNFLPLGASDLSPRACPGRSCSAARVVRNIAPTRATGVEKHMAGDAPGTGQAFYPWMWRPRAVDPAAHGSPGGRRGRIESLASPSRRDRAGQCRGAVVAPELAANPIGVGGAAVIGAVVGDSIGHWIGRRFGLLGLRPLGRRFPKHFGPGQVSRLAERLFNQESEPCSVAIALLGDIRPLAGALKPYLRFLAANITGGICWAGGTTSLAHFAGMAAQHWLERFSFCAVIAASPHYGRDLVANALRDRRTEAEHCRKAGTTAA